MSVLNENFVLANGQSIPKLGFGTWQISNEDVVAAVDSALKIGYTHIDTAVGYGNETGVAKGIANNGAKREDLYITTKIPADVKSYEDAKKTIEKSLSDLNMDYVDLMLIHAPKPWPEMFGDSKNMYFEENAAVWKAMEEAYKAGKFKAIGVSNFEIVDLKNLMDNCEIVPMANQIKIHIGYTEDELVNFCNQNKILVEGYSPIATGGLLQNGDVAAIAKNYDASVAQLCIRYVLQKDILPLPKSTHEEYIRDNTKIDFEISKADMAALDKMQVES